MTLPSASLDLSEFNRRAIIALRALDLDDHRFDAGFVANVGKLIDRHYSLTDLQQISLYRVVLRRRRQIVDTLVVDYAAERAREA